MKRALKWAGLALLAIVLVLAAPVIWVETACRGLILAQDDRPLATGTRDESRTFTTYPEWHIVHAYEDYAATIAHADPHDFGFLRAIAGFWTSLCPLAEMADAHGGFTTESRMTIYTIGVSFSAEMALKAAYEETLGRVATWVRGPDHAALDRLSAQQAADYAAFLQMTPWYRWDFRRDAAALGPASQGSFRDVERRLALGLEYRAKAVYAGLIAQAVAATGQDELTLRAVVADLPPEALAAIPGVTVITTRPEGVEVETPRYRAFTLIAGQIAAQGGRFVEIAGNDDILLTALAPAPLPGALSSHARQGHGDTRSLILTRVADLAAVVNGLPTQGAQLEHIHDY